MKKFEIYLKETNGDLGYIQFEKTLEEAEKTTKTLSKTMIKEAIKSGASIDGAIIKINKSLQIK